MKGARAVVLVHAGPDGVVRIHALAGGAAREKLQEDFEVAKTRNDLVDAGDGDERARQREAHAAVAFALDDADATSFGDEEVRAADRSRHAQELLAKEEARGIGEIFGRVAKVGQVHLALEDLVNLLTVFVQCGDDDV